ncbi:hypothetical protein [Actinoplanes siamensis]|uniref:Uncharacterized protein n=1 Tax=Actinoplanes siamensis TaxID=1223317 RepID=A0A919TQ75_9ACTN|nr:hypothetical protein [Actinoplanes siamensis]GIF09833.1 hypothetical protein Asi03nite_73710 [Actinoplanes siamensis]
MSKVCHLLEDSSSLSPVGQLFLARRATRVPYDRGLTGDELVSAAHGRADRSVVRLLDLVQSRYGGTRYASHFFDTDIQMIPTCEPEDAEPLRIDYVVFTGSLAGAHIEGDGSFRIGLDENDTTDFATVDNLIECDARLEVLRDYPFVREFYSEALPAGDELLKALRNVVADVRLVDEASGRLTSVFAGSGLTVFVSRTWNVLGGMMAPMIKVGAVGEALLDGAIATVR